VVAQASQARWEMSAQIKVFLEAFPFFSAETVTEVQRRGLLSFPNHGLWRYGDDHNGSTRSLNGRKYIRADNRGEDWHRLIGLRDVVENVRRYVIFVLEGSKDALAAFEFAHRAGIMLQVGVVVALGTGYRPITAELLQLRGRRVLIIGDRDGAGIQSLGRISKALCVEGIDHVALNWNSFPTDGAKDLFDLLRLCDGNIEKFGRFQFLSTNSFFSSPSLPQSSQFSQSSLFSPKGLTPFICTAKGQRNRKLFDLARATRQIETAREKKLSGSELSAVFEAWYTPSSPFIEMKRDECLIHFLRVREKVRFIAADLREAFASAQSEPLPDIGIECLQLQKIAALCRELQRGAPEHPFFLSVRTAKRFAEFASESAAHNALRVLESLGVIQCVERGIPGKPRATRWRYLLR
jgi:Toprim-like